MKRGVESNGGTFSLYFSRSCTHLLGIRAGSFAHKDSKKRDYVLKWVFETADISWFTDSIHDKKLRRTDAYRLAEGDPECEESVVEGQKEERYLGWFNMCISKHITATLERLLRRLIIEGGETRHVCTGPVRVSLRA